MDQNRPPRTLKVMRASAATRMACAGSLLNAWPKLRMSVSMDCTPDCNACDARSKSTKSANTDDCCGCCVLCRHHDEADRLSRRRFLFWSFLCSAVTTTLVPWAANPPTATVAIPAMVGTGGIDPVDSRSILPWNSVDSAKVE